jgi:hypothetical protein
MKGCELYGRYVFFDTDKNARLEQRKTRKAPRDESREEEAGLARQESLNLSEPKIPAPTFLRRQSRR